jgi:GTP-binding protein EngB required for normal cell division
VSKLVDGARKLFGREGGGGVADRVEALEDFVVAATGRLDEARLEPARQVAERAQQRLRLSSEHTIVALAGATGSGKSSLFNKLTDLELAGVGVKRPTTSWALACAWGPEGASEILSWIGIPERHQVSRMSMLDASAEDTNLQGLVLLDLPDHDSTEVSHHLEVDRLVGYADLLVWVLDPQKYADAAIHDRYLKPLASHADVMLVVLNHVDRIPEAERESTLADVRRILDADGLGDVPVLATSATAGIGLDDLKRALVRRIRDKESATQRLALDVSTTAEQLTPVNGVDPARGVTTENRARFDAALADAAGVPVIVDAVQRSVRQRHRRTMGWPPMRLLGRFRSDPLDGLGLEPGALSRSTPTTSPVQRSRVDTAVRDLADDAATGLPPTWSTVVSAAATRRLPELAESMDAAVSGTDLGATRTPAWVRAVGVLQLLLLLSAVGGLGWMVALLVLDLSGSESPDPPQVGGLSVPLLMLLVGVVVGWVLAVLAGALAGRSAAGVARRADDRLRTSIAQVADSHVVEPLTTELAQHERARTALVRALEG